MLVVHAPHHPLEEAEVLGAKPGPNPKLHEIPAHKAVVVSAVSVAQFRERCGH
jgi:hypothetical protein